MPKVEYLLTAAPPGRLRVAFGMEGRISPWERIRPVQYRTFSVQEDVNRFAMLIPAEREERLAELVDSLIGDTLQASGLVKLMELLTGDTADASAMIVRLQEWAETMLPGAIVATDPLLGDQERTGMRIQQVVGADTAQESALIVDGTGWGDSAPAAALVPQVPSTATRTPTAARVDREGPTADRTPPSAVVDVRMPTGDLTDRAALEVRHAPVADQIDTARVDVANPLADRVNPEATGTMDTSVLGEVAHDGMPVISGSLGEHDVDVVVLRPVTQHERDPLEASVDGRTVTAEPGDRDGQPLRSVQGENEPADAAVFKSVEGSRGDADATVQRQLYLADMIERLGQIETLLNAERLMPEAILSVLRMGEIDQHNGYLTDGFVSHGDVDLFVNIPKMTGIDRLNPPEIDFRYRPETIYDPGTGAVKAAIGDDSYAEVAVKLPDQHPLEPYGDGRQVVDVPLGLYQRFAEEILVFFDKRLAALLGEGADRTIPLMLAHLRGILLTAPLIAERTLLERTFRFVRWVAEEAVLRHAQYVLVREYADWTAPDGESWRQLSAGYDPIRVTSTAAVFGRLTWQMTGQDFLMEAEIDGAPVRISQEGQNYAVPMPPGEHEFSLKVWSGNAMVRGFSRTGHRFTGATMKKTFPPDSGPKSIQYVVKRLIEYWRLHHENKQKGTRERWLLDD